MNQIKDLFLSGHLKAGDRLPPERDMMDMFEVGRTTLREALKGLESIGLIERSPKGTFISTNFNNAYAESLVYQFYVSEAEWDEIYEARRMIEKEMAYLTARRSTEEELAGIRMTVELMEKAVLSGDQANYVESNVLFHERIANAAGNKVLLDIYHSISNLVVQSQKVLGMHQEQTLVKSVMKDSLEYHQQICKALEGRNAEAARKLMEEHIGIVQGYFKKA
ncbi:FadR/GntR family transcriptional regulator [Paenisporosarcina indica]|uniref:FadR/GntR family transcriptional regulator n=1 Tax=Paenisporosarcina indica TaxID=650093 RepID=UPI001FE4CFAD|nr:FadR/GntR family transcriptional regulator [Paenisporosarcina indica]